MKIFQNMGGGGGVTIFKVHFAKLKKQYFNNLESNISFKGLNFP